MRAHANHDKLLGRRFVGAAESKEKESGRGLLAKRRLRKRNRVGLLALAVTRKSEKSELRRGSERRAG